MLIALILLIVLVVYIYVGYPLLLASGLLGRCLPARSRPGTPSVSILIPAHNEENVIAAKIENLLAVNYPREQVEILVGNDGSRDRTAEVVRRYESQSVLLIDAGRQRGKSGVQNMLAEAATGSILVFTDADCMLASDALSAIVARFADPSVGLVTAFARYPNTGETTVAENEGLYWRYERWLRQQESDRGLLAMASGSLFAVRRMLWSPLDANVGDDFVLPIQVALQGFRNVTAPDVDVTSRLTQVHVESMMRMKMRIVSKDLRGLLDNAAILSPFTAGAKAVAMWSHKLLRWLVPFFLIAIFLINLLTAYQHPVLGAMLLAQVLFYALAALGWSRSKRGLPSPWSVPFSFCLVNTAALLGTLHYARGGKMGIWNPVREARPNAN